MLYKLKHHYLIYLGVVTILTGVMALCYGLAVYILRIHFSFDVASIIPITTLISAVYDVSVIFSALILSYLSDCSKKGFDIEFLTSVEVNVLNLNFFKAISIVLLFAVIYAVLSYNVLSFSVVLGLVLSDKQLALVSVIALIGIISLFYVIKIFYMLHIDLIPALLFLLEKIRPLAPQKTISE
ncbi:MAG: hypothetical protein LBV79_09215 [Candidatus Adiutrix sp.]|jgi:hypothetical protein|nr:hypothetical protein [Candidatus Adiutrix sp.]